MATSIMPTYNAFKINNAGLVETKNVSIDSDNEKKCDSGYSLSDIEEALNTSSVSSHATTTKLFMSTTDTESCFKYRKPDPLLARAFVKDKDCSKENEDLQSLVKRRDSRKRLSSEMRLSCDSVKTRLSRHRSVGLAVKQETAVLGAKKLTRMLTDSKLAANTNLNNNIKEEILQVNEVDLLKNEIPKVPESDVCTSPSSSEKSEFSDNAVFDPNNRSEELKRNIFRRQRSQTLSKIYSSSSHRSRFSSMMDRRNTMNIAPKIEDSTSTASSTLRKMKHYQRALDAYRKSAEKARNSSEADKDMPRYNSLPLRGARHIPDFWGTQHLSCTPESDDKASESGKSTDRSSCSSGSTHGEDISTLRRWPFVPVTGDTRSRFGNDDSLNLDYRNVSRYGSMKRWNVSSARNNPNRISIDPETVTDIDFIVGLNEAELPNSKSKTSPGSDIKSDQSKEEVNPAVPEKIVWSEYDRYLRYQTNSLPRSRTRLRLGVYEKNDTDNQTISNNPAEESPYVNLRRNHMIRERNVTRTNSHAGYATLKSSKKTISRQSSAPVTHDTASPSKLSQFFSKQLSESKLSPLPSPSLPRNERASNLKTKPLDVDLKHPTPQTTPLVLKKAILHKQQLPAVDLAFDQSADTASPVHLFHSLPRMKSAESSSTQNISSNDNQTSSKAGLFLSRYKSSYAHPNIYDKLRESSKRPSYSSSTSHKATMKSTSTLTKPTSRQHARTPPVDKHTFTPGAYTSAATNSDSDDDYVSYDTFYNIQSTNVTTKPRTGTIKQAQQCSSSDRPLRKMPTTNSCFYQTSSTSNLSLSREKTLPLKSNKPVKTSLDRLKKSESGSKIRAHRSASTADVSNGKVNPIKSKTLPSFSSTQSIDRKMSFISRDLFYGVSRKQSKRKSLKQKRREISVPLTDYVREIDAKYSLTLPRKSFDKAKKRNSTLRRISSFINNNESILRLGSLNDVRSSSEIARSPILISTPAESGTY